MHLQRLVIYAVTVCAHEQAAVTQKTSCEAVKTTGRVTERSGPAGEDFIGLTVKKKNQCFIKTGSMKC